MAGGTGPLAADNPGYREVLRDRFSELIFPVQDEERLAERIRGFRQLKTLLVNGPLGFLNQCVNSTCCIHRL